MPCAGKGAFCKYFPEKSFPTYPKLVHSGSQYPLRQSEPHLMSAVSGRVVKVALGLINELKIIINIFYRLSAPIIITYFLIKRIRKKLETYTGNSN